VKHEVGGGIQVLGQGAVVELGGEPRRCGVEGFLYPAPVGRAPCILNARTAATSSAPTVEARRPTARVVWRAAREAKLAWFSTPWEMKTALWEAAGVASSLSSPAAEFTVYSKVMRPESGPGFSARNGLIPLVSGFMRAERRAAEREAA
jgi:hypothetical protein